MADCRVIPFRASLHSWMSLFWLHNHLTAECKQPADHIHRQPPEARFDIVLVCLVNVWNDTKCTMQHHRDHK